MFKALADPTRRALLDELYRQDGQSLTELGARLPTMTRFGVMKHLKVLEEAHLVTTKRRGREKLHFLNPVPIRLVHDRWVSKYAAPWAATLTGLKKRTTWRGVACTMEKVFEIYIKTTPEQLWEAITDPGCGARYTFGVRDRVRLDTRARRYEATVRRREHRDRRGREPRGRSAPPARAELRRALERRRQGRGNLAA